MKKKTLLYSLLGSLLLLSGCDSFLDTNDLTEKNTGTFPKTKADADAMLTGIYATLSNAVGNPQNTYFYVAQLASDDCLGGGGENDKLMQAEDFLMYSNDTDWKTFWEARYQGIFRANTALETLDNCTGWENDEQKNQVKGEVYFLRAFFYYEMTSLFGKVPLVTKTEPLNLPKATPEELYGQMGADLKNAITLMSSKKYNQYVSAGHATKWTAEAIMARMFLFYTDMYNKTEIALPGGGTITKQNVIDWLKDCIDNSGHTLVSDYRNLWAYTNKYTVEDYSYTKGKNLSWVENNSSIDAESVFAIKFSTFTNWDSPNKLGSNNQYALHFGIRGGQDYANTFPFGQGWGAGPVNPGLWNDWKAAEPTDMRRAASICDIPTELPGYKKGGWADFMQETDYWQKKVVPISAKTTSGSYDVSFCVQMYNASTNMQLTNLQDLVVIRFADVLLMHSELSGTPDGMNRVRARAGLGTVAYSLTALQNERRWEFACEGIRWNDIRRWGIAGDVLEKQVGQPIYNKANPTLNKSIGGGYKARYNATKGFFRIPQSQILLSNGVLTQNDGWGTNAIYTGWN